MSGTGGSICPKASPNESLATESAFFFALFLEPFDIPLFFAIVDEIKINI